MYVLYYTDYEDFFTISMVFFSYFHATIFSALQKALIFQKNYIASTCFNYNIFPM